MFPSLSSCSPSTSVTSSFTSTKAQDLIINQPVKVVGPNLYYITSTINGFAVSATQFGSTALNPELKLIQGISYKFYVNSPNESIYLTTTSGTEYTTGLRYVFNKNTDYFNGTGSTIQIIPVTTASNTFVITTAIAGTNIGVWGQPVGATSRSLFTEGLDYTFVRTGGDLTYTFTVDQDNITLYFIPGRFTLSSSLHFRNYLVKTNGVTRTPVVDYLIVGNKISFTNPYSTTTLISVEEHGGMSGYFIFTPIASTPSVLLYKSRASTNLSGYLSITVSGKIFTTSTAFRLVEKDTVSVTVTSPANYLGYQFYQYHLDGMLNYFAVVNKNNYTPLVKTAERKKRFYNYVNYGSSITIYETSSKAELYTSSRGLGVADTSGTVNILASHIVLEPVNSKVNFYAGTGVLVKTVYLPDFPIQYEKLTSTIGSVTRTDLLVLAANGILYIIDSNLNVTEMPKFSPAVRDSGFLLDNLPIEEDIPFQGTFTAAARKSLVTSLFPVVTSFAIYSPSATYLVGSNVIAKVNINTKVIYAQNQYNALDEFLNISPFDAFGVIVTTVSHRIFYIRESGAPINLTPSGGPFVLGVHCTMPFDRGGRVVIPDCHNRRLIVINSNLVSDVTFINLGDFVPAYARRFGDTVYVTGHDSNRVIAIDVVDLSTYVITESSGTKITHYDFSQKVTLVSAYGSSLIAHHYLNNRTILDFAGTGIKKIIPVEFSYREGPGSSIGTDPRIIRLLGEDTVVPVPGPYMNWWVNGSIRATVKDGEYLGINYRGSVPGPHRGVIILGENAIDYDTKTVSSDAVTDYFSAGTSGNHILAYSGFNIFYAAPVDAIGEYTLPFSINFYGQNYSSFLLGTNGILSFNTGYPISSIVPNFSNATTDALLIQPKALYIDRPIDNSNVANVTWAPLPGSKTPGTYYTSGILGEFTYYRFKFVGTTASPVPNGFVRQTEAVDQVGVEINMLNSTTIAVNDYVSNPISSAGPPYETIVSTGPVVGNPSCRVLAVSNYLIGVGAYFTIGNVIYVTNSIVAPKKYSKITNSTGGVFGYSNQIFTSELLPANLVISVNNATNSIIVEGTVNPQVTTRHIFEVVTNSVTEVRERGTTLPYYTTILSTTTSTNTIDLVTAVSITPETSIFTPVVGRTANSYVQVAQSVYNGLVVGQTLFSSIFATSELIVDKVILSKTFNLTITPAEGIEGVPGLLAPTEFSIDVLALNVEDGTNLTAQISGAVTVGGPNSDFDYSVVLEWPNTSRPNDTIDLASSFVLPIYGQSVRIRITVRPDSFVEGREDFTITIGGINPGSSTTMSLSAAIGRNISRSGVTLASPISYLNYFIVFANLYTTTTSTQFSTRTTRIQFASLPAFVAAGVATTITAGVDTIINTADDIQTIVTSSTTVSYKLFKIETIQNSLITLTGTVVPITAAGKFITLSLAQNLPANTSMLFKAPDFHPIVEYDVSFYTGKNFQYIEYNYIGQPEHDNSLTIGLRNSTGTYQIQIPGTPAGVYSRLFGSDSGSGILIDLGAGEFTQYPLAAFIPRYPRIYRERVFDNTTVRYDVYIDYKIPSTSDVRASLDYGYLRINDGFYDGTVPVKENDIFSVVVPFQQNRQVSAVIFSLGSAQFAIAVAPEPDIKTKQDTTFTLPGQATVQNIQSSFIIPATGSYMIPDYFRSATGTGGAELEFERWVSFLGGPAVYDRSLARGAYHELSQGDEIIVKNIFTGYRSFNIIEILFAGVTISRFRVETSGAPDLVNYLNYEPLIEPYTYQYRQGNLLVYDQPTVFLNAPGFEKVANIGQFNFNGVGSSFTETFSAESPTALYEARSLILGLTSGTLGSQVNLFVSGSNVNFIINGNRTGANVVTVSSGSLIGLEWDLYSYHAPNTKIYQLTQDPIDNSTVYTEVGQWTIQNKALDVLLINGNRGSGKSVKEIKIISNGYGYLNETISVSISASPTGESATGQAILSASGGEVIAIALTNAGSGYVTAPIVTITGGNTAPAIAQALLVDNIVPRENLLQIRFDAKQDSYTPGISDNYDYLPVLEGRYTENKIKQEYTLGAFNYLFGNIQGKFDPYDYQILSAFQVQTKFIAETLFAGKLGYTFTQHPSVLTGISTSQYIKYDLLAVQIPSSELISFINPTSKYQNDERVLHQATTSLGYHSWDTTLASTLFYSRNTGEFATISYINAKAADPQYLSPATLFASIQSFTVPKMYQILQRKLSSDFLTFFAIESDPAISKMFVPQTQLNKGLPNDPNRQIGTNVYDKWEFKFEPDSTIINLELAEEFTVFTPIDSQTISSSPLYITQINEQTILGSFLHYQANIFGNISEVYARQTGVIGDGDGSTLMTFDTVAYDVYHTGMEYDYSTIIIIDADGADADVAYPASGASVGMTYSSTIVDTQFIKNTEFQLSIDNLQSKDLTLFFYNNNPIELESFELNYTSVSTIPVPYSYNLVPTQPGFAQDFDPQLIKDLSPNYNLTLSFIQDYQHLIDFDPRLIEDSIQNIDFLPKFINDNSADVEFPPELYSQDKLFIDFDAELYFPDKLFVDFDPEVYSQDKLFIDFDAELDYQDKLFTEFIPELADAGNRYIELLPELTDPGNRYIELLPELEDAGNRYIELLPELADPGNRYIDFIPLLLHEEYLRTKLNPDMGYNETLIPLPPVLDISRGILITMDWERDIPKNLYITLEPLLAQDGFEWYFDEFDKYGAHSTEFLFYADQGRGGDLGQYQGTVPGTPGRTQGPILAYREFMGSALVSKIPYYGVGSFTTQAAAAAIAAKYVDAREFQIRGTNYWNYRIYFGRKTFHPRVSKIFPTVWYIRGG